MIGALIGDIVGSVHQFQASKHTEFPLYVEGSTFTDDSVLTVAVADCLLTSGSYVDLLKTYTRRYPNRVYGMKYWYWSNSDSREPYNSWGNGSAMRVSPVAYAFETMEEVLEEAKRSAEVTHNHPEGIKGAQATAASIFLAREGESKRKIRKFIQKNFKYDLKRTVVNIRPGYTFNESCQKTVPEAIIAFLDSEDYVDCIRLAISLGGDADTLACIAGGIAGAFYGKIPADVCEPGLALLDEKLLGVTRTFCSRYGIEFPGEKD